MSETERPDPPPERDDQPSQNPRQHPPITEEPGGRVEPGQQFPVENQPAEPEGGKGE